MYDTIIDSGASCHIVIYMQYATAKYNFQPSTKHTVHLGDHSVKLEAVGTCTIGILERVLIVPRMTLNLISGPALEKSGYGTLCRQKQCHITSSMIA